MEAHGGDNPALRQLIQEYDKARDRQKKDILLPQSPTSNVLYSAHHHIIVLIG
jgi:ABC-type Fe2+-enterobactin transport system substrate-binding protein